MRATILEHPGCSQEGVPDKIERAVEREPGCNNPEACAETDGSQRCKHTEESPRFRG